jgi:hypothetical protein
MWNSFFAFSLLLIIVILIFFEVDTINQNCCTLEADRRLRLSLLYGRSSYSILFAILP